MDREKEMMKANTSEKSGKILLQSPMVDGLRLYRVIHRHDNGTRVDPRLSSCGFKAKQVPNRGVARYTIRVWLDTFNSALLMRELRVEGGVICRRLAYTYTCAHVGTHANFVSLRSLTAQDQLCARSSKRSACAWECRCCLLAVQSNLRL